MTNLTINPRGTITTTDTKSLCALLKVLGYEVESLDELGGGLWSLHKSNGKTLSYRVYCYPSKNADGDALPTKWEAYRT